MRPSVGRIVHVYADPRWNNGADMAPAVITRVWDDETERNLGYPNGSVNLRVLHDAVPSDRDWKTSVPVYDTRDEADAAHAKLVSAWKDAGVEPDRQPPHRCWWPPRAEHEPGDRPPRY